MHAVRQRYDQDNLQKCSETPRLNKKKTKKNNPIAVKATVHKTYRLYEKKLVSWSTEPQKNNQRDEENACAQTEKIIS